MKTSMTIREAAERWGITVRRITQLCKEGRIEGAVKQGRVWLIPATAEKPSDNRIRSGAYIKAARPSNLPLPVGVSDYRLASTEYYYIDKTMLIKDFLDERPMVSLFTRPRRFGKTLNMDMLRTFFEKVDEDTSVYFKDKKIWSCGQKYREYQGRYPVIFITLKDVKCETWGETYEKIASILSSEFSRHKEVLSSDRCDASDKRYFEKVVDLQASPNELTSALLVLSRMLDVHYGIAPIIIIDEYDTPIQQGHVSDFYDKVILFMRNLFSGGLKDNRHLSYGFLTGILRVAKESIFSGLNNLKINSVLDNKYSEYFGFTANEVREMAQYYGAADKYAELCQWYDSYRFGNSDIFNPWSVINYFSNECMPRAFWLSTGSNDIIGEILANADEEIYEHLHALLQNKTFLTYIDTSVIYPQIRSNPSSIYSFLLVAGYLKSNRSTIAPNGDFMCEVAIPNREISLVYNKELLSRLQHIIPQSTALVIQEALYRSDAESLKAGLRKLLLESVSCFDTAGENFYHGLVLGLCAMCDNRYYVTSNRESGEGRYDIQLMPKDTSLPGILIELKAAKDPSANLSVLARQAVDQIVACHYDTEMTSRGISDVARYGIAFRGKDVEIQIK